MNYWVDSLEVQGRSLGFSNHIGAYQHREWVVKPLELLRSFRKYILIEYKEIQGHEQVHYKI